MELNPNIKIAQIQSIIGKMEESVYNPKYTVDAVDLLNTHSPGMGLELSVNYKTDINYYKRVGIISILLTDNTVDNIQDITANIDKGSMIIVYGDNITKHDSYIFDGQVIASAFLKGNADLQEPDCTLQIGKAVDGTIMVQILYKHRGGNYCVKLPAELSLEQITEYGINFSGGNRLMFIQTFAGFAYYADFYKISMHGYIEFIRI